MIRISKDEQRLLLEYSPDGIASAEWVNEKLRVEGKVNLKGIFLFSKDSIILSDDDYDEDFLTFLLGELRGDYYVIHQDILGIGRDLWLFRDMKINKKTFVATRGISIFRKIDRLVKEPIIIGGPDPLAVLELDFQELLNNFPTSTELTHYSDARIAGVLRDYFDTMPDSQRKLEVFVNKRKTIKRDNPIQFLRDYEPRKFEYVRDEIIKMLASPDSYSELEWQKIIISFILIIFPKYVAVLENLHIADYYSNSPKLTNRFIDLALVDASGTIDVIEIKKPFSNCLLTTNKYRDNFVPKKELSGSVMQLEKYIFHLSKWGVQGERAIQTKRGEELPNKLQINITNPKGMIVIGRDQDFSDEERFDFEIIKRKYSNIMDIMTYDDLLRRLENIITMIGNNFVKSK